MIQQLQSALIRLHDGFCGLICALDKHHGAQNYMCVVQKVIIS